MQNVLIETPYRGRVGARYHASANGTCELKGSPLFFLLSKLDERRERTLHQMADFAFVLEKGAQTASDGRLCLCFFFPAPVKQCFSCAGRSVDPPKNWSTLYKVDIGTKHESLFVAESRRPTLPSRI